MLENGSSFWNAAHGLAARVRTVVKGQLIPCGIGLVLLFAAFLKTENMSAGRMSESGFFGSRPYL